MKIDTSKVTRLEVIDHASGSGRMVLTSPSDGVRIELSFQDEGRTLKVFVSPRTKGPEHVCGLQGFGRGIDGMNDVCPACREQYSQYCVREEK